jgi:hypothetical protein
MAKPLTAPSGRPPGSVTKKRVPLFADAAGHAVYDAERVCRVVRNLCLLGLTDVVISEELGISLSTYYKWRETYPELDQTVREAKALADGEVAASVFKVATGFTKTEQRAIATKTGVEIVDVEVEVDPDGKIGLQWLRQRQGRMWREVIHVEDTSADKEAIAAYQRRLAQAEQDDDGEQ